MPATNVALQIVKTAEATPEKRKRGRPPGSKSRPHAMLSRAAIAEFSKQVGPYLAPDDLSYLTKVLAGETDPLLNKDIDIFLALQFKALLPQLAEEIKSGQLTREATSRSSIVKELLALRFQMEKNEKGDENANQYTFIQNIFQSRGIDTGRLFELVSGTGTAGELPSGLHGSADRDEGQADTAGAVSGEVLERPVEVQDRR